MANLTTATSGQYAFGARQVVEWLTNPLHEDSAIWVLSNVRKARPILWQKAQDERTARAHFGASARSLRFARDSCGGQEYPRPKSLLLQDDAEAEHLALLDDDSAGNKVYVTSCSTHDHRDGDTAKGSASGHLTARSTASQPSARSTASKTSDMSMSSLSRSRASTFMASHSYYERPPLPDEGIHDKTPVLMFNDSVYLSYEEQGVVKIDVLRVGDASKTSKVHWSTRDGSAKAGQTYVASEGILTFEPGDSLLTIEVLLISNVLWDSMLEFKVLLDRKGLTNGILDRWMCEAKVQVFNDDPFPTNRYRELLAAGRADAVPAFVLIRAYIATNRRNRDIWIRTVKGIIVDQLHNMIVCSGLFVQVFIIDYVLNLQQTEGSFFMQSREYTLFLLAGAKLIANFIMHVLDYRLAKYSSVIGPSKEMVQSSILRQYFYCLDSCRSDHGFTGLLMAISNDTDTIVEHLYKIASKVYMHVGKLIAFFIFQMCAPFVFGKTMNLFPLIVTLVFPVLMGCFLACRQDITSRILSSCRDMHYSFCQEVDQIAAAFPMITVFSKQSLVENDLIQKAAARNLEANRASLVILNNMYFANWLTLFVLIAYTVIGGLHVLHGLGSMGFFLTNLGLMQQMGAIWSDLFRDLVKIQSAVPALVRIANFLNMPTNLEHRKKAKDHVGKHRSIAANIDESPIVIQGFQEYLTRTPCRDDNIIELQQGRMIALTSPRSGGKTTLLRLLGGLLAPAANLHVHICLPSHLRILCLGSVPLFFHGTLAGNLLLGLRQNDPDRNLVRMVSILRKLGVKNNVIDRIQDTEVSEHWQLILSESTSHLLNLARALLANPDVLCIEKPTLKLDDHASDKVLDVLRQFIVEKGLECSFPAGCRRPRTVVYTTERVRAVEASDIVLYVDMSGQVKKMGKGDFTTGALSSMMIQI